jgi:hypothetical protein
MEKDKNKSPSANYSDDVPEGLFISPLDDSESFRKMEAEEAKILSPPRIIPANTAASEDFAPSAAQDTTEQEDAAHVPPPKSAEAASEQLMLRFAGELKSIKQDLLSIKQHFEALKRTQPASVMQSAAGQPAAMEPAGMQPTGMQPAAGQPAAMEPVAVQPSSIQPEPMQPSAVQPAAASAQPAAVRPTDPATTALLNDIKKLLLYLDRLLESLPEEKIEEFANSEYFSLYRNIFEHLGLS